MALVDYEVQGAVWKRVRLLRHITGNTKYFTTALLGVRRFVAIGVLSQTIWSKIPPGKGSSAPHYWHYYWNYNWPYLQYFAVY